MLFVKKRVTFRKLRCIDMDFLFRDICDSSRLQNESEDLKVLTEQYDEILCSVLNNHAPLKQRVVTIRTSAPWNNQEVASEKIKRLRLERKCMA